MRKRLLWLLPFFVLLALDGVYSYNAQIKGRPKTPLPPESGLELYVPNSYLEVLIWKLVQGHASRVYDTNSHIVYDVKYLTTGANYKEFAVTAIRKDYQERRRQSALNDQRAAFDSSFTTKHIIRTDYTNGMIRIALKGNDGSSNPLLSIPLQSLQVAYLDKQNPYEATGIPSVAFSSRSIGISYLKDNTALRKLCNDLDQQSRYQNPGLSAIFSFDYLTAYIKSRPIQLQVPNGFGNLLLEGLRFLHNTDTTMTLRLLLNSSSSAFMPRHLQIDAIVYKTTNTIRKVESFTYDANGLSAFEKKQMESAISKIKEESKKGLVGRPLSAQMRGIKLLFSGTNQQFTGTATNDGFFSYRPDQLITTIHLH